MGGIFADKSLSKTKKIDKKNVKKVKLVAEQKFTMSVFVRIHWLPTGLEDEIKEFLEKKAKFLAVELVQSEKWDQGRSSIENGVYSVKLKYEINDHQNFLNFGGYHKINDLGALIQICGMPEKCLNCSEFGHMRKNCPDRNKKCQKCDKFGHSEHKCWSSRLNNNNNDLEENENDEIVDENNEEENRVSKSLLGEESQIEEPEDDKEITASQIESISDIVKNMVKNGTKENKKRKKDFMQELKSLNTSNNSSILSGGSPYSKKQADEKSAINKSGDESMNEKIE